MSTAGPAVPMRPVLYSFRRCPYAMRARMAIAISGQTVELREVVLKAKPAELLLASPKGSVPVLVRPDGQVVDESLDIMVWALQQHDPERWLGDDTDALAAMQALITSCDGDFKYHLDRYKYPERYTDVDPLHHRTAGALFLQQLEARLQAADNLFGANPTLADMAIAPFVRQFALIDAAWFAAQDWPNLARWLQRFLDHPRFAAIMAKYAPWQSGTAGVRFPAPTITLYEYTSQPPFWIAHDDDGYWLVPARNGGWAERHPFVGHVMNLRPLQNTNGIMLGLPGD